jgi:hypothetical protein
MKLYAILRPPQDTMTQKYTHSMHRLMSDYEVNLVNDNMQEFYVRFYGPSESALSPWPSEPLNNNERDN